MIKMQDLVGVIGGVGPMATAYYMQRVVDMTEADCDQGHINMIVYNHCTIPDRTAYIIGKSSENPVPFMQEDAKKLEASGCQFIAIPCNTAHFFYEEIQEAVSIPVINIVSETIRYAALLIKDLTKVGILATDGTIQTGTYQKYAEEAGLSWVIPDKKEQELVMHIIYGCIKAGKPVALHDFELVCNHLREKGAQCLLLACTELSVLKRDLHIKDEDVLDSIDVLANETVRRSGKPVSKIVLLP